MAASDRHELGFFLLRYVPDAVKEEFVNIGVVIVGWHGCRICRCAVHSGLAAGAVFGSGGGPGIGAGAGAGYSDAVDGWGGTGGYSLPASGFVLQHDFSFRLREVVWVRSLLWS